MARVSFSMELAQAVCSEIAKGRKLVDVCADEGMPHRDTFYQWMRDHAGVSDMYTRAREERADLIADEILEIADAPLDVPKDEDDAAGKAKFRQALEQRRQMIDARKWAAAKLNPKTYGDRVNLDADMRINLTEDQVKSRLAYLCGKAGVAVPVGGDGEADAAA